jgi:L-alanine-DL-glutamate epimerase-like enolase superfamily enzyme
MVTITTDEGAVGRYIEDDVMVVDQLTADPGIIRDIVAPAVLGEDPFFRERIWQRLTRLQRLHLTRFHDRILAVIDVALWDLLGQITGLPIAKLAGAFRDEVPAYASTMMGETRGPLATPAGFADFAAQCRDRGFQAFKLHTWAPLLTGDVDWRRDAEACAAVRERVGGDMNLMLDPWHFYDRQDALSLGRAIEELDFFWYEEPMSEASMESYAWLSQRLTVPITGPEIAGGRIQTRADWILNGACDIIRAGVLDIGGITPLLKFTALCESLAVPFTLHLGGVASLHVLATTSVNGWYYERGLLHPELDVDAVPAWLASPLEVMDERGVMSLPTRPGVGYDLDHDYLDGNSEVIASVAADG